MRLVECTTCKKRYNARNLINLNNEKCCPYCYTQVGKKKVTLPREWAEADVKYMEGPHD